jgi:hypothetical protein
MDMWEDQWQRIMRWYRRVERGRDQPRTDAEGTEGYRDELFALYQALWHLKDWLKNDPMTAYAEGGPGKTVETWLTTTAVYLPIAADVANRTKHMRQKPAMKRAGGSEPTRNDVTIAIGRGVMHTFYIQDQREGGEEYEAVNLAERCIDEWRGFLAAHKLDPDPNGWASGPALRSNGAPD